MRTLLSWAVLVLVVLGGYLIAGPTSLGGPASYVIVDGASMEPTYGHGDLVLARRQANYEVRDIVTFVAPDGHDAAYHVIHRIVEVKPEGYVTQGDNRDTVDPWLLSHEDVLGASVVRIPSVGSLLATDRQRAVALGLGAGLLVLGAGGARVLTRRRPWPTGARTRKRRRMVPAKATRTRSMGLAGPSWAPTVLAIALVALVAFSWVTWTAIRTPDTSTSTHSEQLLTHRVDYSYTASARPSLVYPDGQVGPVVADDDAPVVANDDGPAPEVETDERAQFEGGVRPPQVLYRTLIDRVIVKVGHHVEIHDDAAGDLAGEYRTYLVVRTGDGWTSRQPLGDPAPIEANATSVERDLDLRQVQSLIERVTDLAETSARSAVVALESEIDVTTTVGGERIDETIVDSFEIRLDGSTLDPTGDLSRVHEITGPAEQTVTANHVLGLPVPAARAAGAAGLLLVLLVSAWLAATIFLGWRRPEHEGILARYGSLIVRVQDDPVRGAQPMRVGSIGALVRLAKREHTAILHEVCKDGRHRFVVPDGLMAFIYETRGIARPLVEAPTNGTPRVPPREQVARPPLAPSTNGGRRMTRRERTAQGGRR